MGQDFALAAGARADDTVEVLDEATIKERVRELLTQSFRSARRCQKIASGEALNQQFMPFPKAAATDC